MAKQGKDPAHVAVVGIVSLVAVVGLVLLFVSLAPFTTVGKAISVKTAYTNEEVMVRDSSAGSSGEKVVKDGVEKLGSQDKAAMAAFIRKDLVQSVPTPQEIQKVLEENNLAYFNPVKDPVTGDWKSGTIISTLSTEKQSPIPGGKIRLTSAQDCTGLKTKLVSLQEYYGNSMRDAPRDTLEVGSGGWDSITTPHDIGTIDEANKVDCNIFFDSPLEKSMRQPNLKRVYSNICGNECRPTGEKHVLLSVSCAVLDPTAIKEDNPIHFIKQQEAADAGTTFEDVVTQERDNNQGSDPYRIKANWVKLVQVTCEHFA